MRGNGDYGMVLQFAGRGSLRDYLSKHFDKLDWTKKLRLARDVASGINFIHLENICHHDLHSRNVLIDDKGKALITDFGLSRYLNKELSNNGVRGVVPYISPERLKNAPFDKSSDIYSLGVIMWELTSGYPPFDRDGENYMLAFHITTGTREKVIPGTPLEYSELYQKCWDGEPSNRPPLSFILDTLDNLLANRTNGGGGSVNDGSSLCLGDPHGPPHSLPTVTQTTGVPPEPLRKSAPIASKVPAIETTFEGQPSKPVANISPLVPKHNLSRNHPVIVTNPDASNTVDVVDRMQGLRVEGKGRPHPTFSLIISTRQYEFLHLLMILTKGVWTFINRHSRKTSWTAHHASPPCVDANSRNTQWRHGHSPHSPKLAQTAYHATPTKPCQDYSTSGPSFERPSRRSSQPQECQRFAHNPRNGRGRLGEYGRNGKPISYAFGFTCYATAASSSILSPATAAAPATTTATWVSC